MHWSAVLDKAAEQFDGGRSFPLASEADFAHNYAYEPPNEDYQKLFFRQATVPGSQHNTLFCPHSAGWLIPNDTSICKPVHRPLEGCLHLYYAKDESVVAWIIKQPVSEETDFTAPPKPISQPAPFWRKRVLGNQSSQYHAAQFLQAWRERGSPFRVAASSLAARARCIRELGACNFSVRDDADREFCFAWNMCTRYEAELAAVHIESRWASALLGQAYSKKIAQIRHNDFISSNDRTRNRYGKGPVRTEAIAALVELVSPNATEGQAGV
ncbi:hypothetical protein P3342_008275 [Pyrenophora teres f. teres]|nr:hypothetical protein P3342_008275 [Pyrenophora teres f. teres]